MIEVLLIEFGSLLHVQADREVGVTTQCQELMLETFRHELSIRGETIVQNLTPNDISSSVKGLNLRGGDYGTFLLILNCWSFSLKSRYWEYNY